MNEREPSRRIVEQRIRNRVIEYLDVVASFDAQRTYEREAPAFVNVPYEIINEWQDWVPEDRGTPATKVLGVYSPDEVEALRSYQAVWEAAAAVVPKDFPSLRDVQSLPEWELLARAAAKAATVFQRRGKLPEDRRLSEGQDSASVVPIAVICG
jgi:hypothetical protein